MKKYNVEVVETLSRVVEVEATTYEEAENKVDEMYHNQDIVLDYNDLESQDLKPYPSRELSESFNINIDFDKNTQDVFIGNEDGSGARYNCKNYDDLISAIKTYCDLYVNYLEPKGEKIKNKDMER